MVLDRFCKPMHPVSCLSCSHIEQISIYRSTPDFMALSRRVPATGPNMNVL
jgi:hypothetical protein